MQIFTWDTRQVRDSIIDTSKAQKGKQVPFHFQKEAVSNDEILKNILK